MATEGTMANTGALRESRETARRAFNDVMEVLEDEDFMAGVLEGIAAERAGDKGKTLEEIRSEYGLTH